MRRLAAAGLLSLGVALAACGGDGGDRGAFCSAVAAADPLDAVFDEDVLDPEQAADKYERALDRYQGFRDVAPGEVRDDLDVLIDLVSDLRDGLAEADPEDPTAGFRVVTSLEDRFAEVEQATQALEDYVATECTAD